MSSALWARAQYITKLGYDENTDFHRFFGGIRNPWELNSRP